jgi:2-oxoglutarate ferredoxin oxidoreductase subunit alpha
MVELPLVVVDVQRAGPSTGMPTKVEQSDLLTAMYGRHGECPVPIIAPSSPSDCFAAVIEAFRIAVESMTPVIVLSDAFLANSAEPWQIPDLKGIPEMHYSYHQDAATFAPYGRDENSLARPWAIPGTPSLEHRIGGLEKEHGSGNISYDPSNHQKMVNVRAQKVQNIAKRLPPLQTLGAEKGELLIVGWGSTYGAIRTVYEDFKAQGFDISALHLRWLNPFPENLATLLKAFKKVVVVELNKGQLCHLLRAQFLIDAKSISKVEGKPFTVSELKTEITPYLKRAH